MIREKLLAQINELNVATARQAARRLSYHSYVNLVRGAPRSQLVVTRTDWLSSNIRIIAYVSLS